MSFMDEIRKIPPVTRFLCGSSLGITLPVILQVVAPYKFVFVRQLVTQKWEVSIVSYLSAFNAYDMSRRYGGCLPASSSEVCT